MGSSMRDFQDLVQMLTVDAEQLKAQTQALQVGGLAELARKKVALEQQLWQQKNATAVLEARNAVAREQLAKVEAKYKGYEDEASKLRIQNVIMAQQLRMAQAALAAAKTPAPAAPHDDGAAVAAVAADSGAGAANHTGDATEATSGGAPGTSAPAQPVAAAAQAGASTEGAKVDASTEGAKDAGSDDNGEGEDGGDDAADESGDDADDDTADLDPATEAAIAASPAVQAAIGLDPSANSGGAGSDAGREVIADPTSDDDAGAAEEVDASKAGSGLSVLSFLATTRGVHAEAATGNAARGTTATALAAGSLLPPLSDGGEVGEGVGAALASISADPQVIVKSLRNFGQGISRVLNLERQGEDKFQAAFDAQFAEGKRKQEALQTEFKNMQSRELSLQTSQKSLVVLVKKLRKERDRMRAQVTGLREQLKVQQDALANLLAATPAAL